MYIILVVAALRSAAPRLIQSIRMEGATTPARRAATTRHSMRDRSVYIRRKPRGSVAHTYIFTAQSVQEANARARARYQSGKAHLFGCRGWTPEQTNRSAACHCRVSRRRRRCYNRFVCARVLLLHEMPTPLQRDFVLHTPHVYVYMCL